MLDSKRAKGAIKLGANSAAGTVMTHKQGKIYTYMKIYLSLNLSYEERYIFLYFYIFSWTASSRKFLYTAPEICCCRYRFTMSLHCLAGSSKWQNFSSGASEKSEQVNNLLVIFIYLRSYRLICICCLQNIGIENLRVGQCCTVTNYETLGGIHKCQCWFEMYV